MKLLKTTIPKSQWEKEVKSIYEKDNLNKHDEKKEKK